MRRAPQDIVDAALPGSDTIFDRAALRSLFAAIVAAWGADTSVDADWSAANPALGQCAVSALLIQERLGGDLLRTTVDGVSHYYNRLGDGSIVDLTASQFAPDAARGEVIERERAYVTGFPETVARLETLRSRVVRQVGW